jgi:hypothetical protein
MLRTQPNMISSTLRGLSYLSLVKLIRLCIADWSSCRSIYFGEYFQSVQGSSRFCLNWCEPLLEKGNAAQRDWNYQVYADSRSECERDDGFVKLNYGIWSPESQICHCYFVVAIMRVKKKGEPGHSRCPNIFRTIQYLQDLGITAPFWGFGPEAYCSHQRDSLCFAGMRGEVNGTLDNCDCLWDPRKRYSKSNYWIKAP